jgi:hypothetical protein
MITACLKSKLAEVLASQGLAPVVPSFGARAARPRGFPACGLGERNKGTLARRRRTQVVVSCVSRGAQQVGTDSMRGQAENSR